MKVKFTKLAALLLAGAALFATGCTDYEVDIQNANKRIDELTSGKVATLEQQVAALQATVATLETAADHDADIATLRSEMAAMKTALETDYQTKIANAVSDLTAKINQKLDKATYDEFKSGYDTWKAGVDSDITKIKEDIVNANTKIQALEQADEAFKTQIQQLTE